jgi:hypothetical protein
VPFAKIGGKVVSDDKAELAFRCIPLVYISDGINGVGNPAAPQFAGIHRKLPVALDCGEQHIKAVIAGFAAAGTLERRLKGRHKYHAVVASFERLVRYRKVPVVDRVKTAA